MAYARTLSIALLLHVYGVSLAAAKAKTGFLMPESHVEDGTSVEEVTESVEKLEALAAEEAKAAAEKVKQAAEAKAKAEAANAAKEKASAELETARRAAAELKQGMIGMVTVTVIVTVIVTSLRTYIEQEKKD